MAESSIESKMDIGSEKEQDDKGNGMPPENNTSSSSTTTMAANRNDLAVSLAAMTQHQPPPSVSFPSAYGSTGFSTEASTSDAGAPPTHQSLSLLADALLSNAVMANNNTTNTNDTTAAVLQATLALHLQQQLQHQLLQQQAAAAIVAAAHPFTHNLIPLHLQASALAASLNGTPGFQPALISPPVFPPISLVAQAPLLQAQQPLIPLQNCIQLPTMTVQDRPHVQPVYNGVNPNYPGLRVLNTNPPVFAVDNFLTPLECQLLVTVASDSFGPAPVVGKGAGEVSASRTSSTCYLAREDLPDYMRKVSLLTGKPIEHMELPQVGRYFPSQQYLQHFDAFDTSTEDGRRFASNGGQRTVTVLVYLNDVPRGGATRFPALGLDVQPRQGMALIFFPATVDGFLDKMALHAALPAIDTKFVSQVWIRQSTYNGQPSKRLPQPMGAPFNPPLGSTPVPQPIANLPTVHMTHPHPVPLTGVGNGSSIPNPFAASNLPATF